MDVQVVCSSTSQLPDCVHDHSFGDLSAVPVGLLPGRKGVEQDEFQIKHSTLCDGHPE